MRLVYTSGRREMKLRLLILCYVVVGKCRSREGMCGRGKGEEIDLFNLIYSKAAFSIIFLRRGRRGGCMQTPT